MYHVINNVLMGLNRVGGVFYDYAASVFIQSALLVILLFAIDLLLRKRVRAVFRYCVWLLVLVKLILPPMLSLPTGIGYWVGDHIPVAPGASNMAFEADALEFAGPSGEMLQVRPAENIAGHDPAMARLHSALIPLTWQAVVFLLWLAGVLAFLAVLVQRIRFVKGLVAASCPADDELTGLLEQCRRQMSVRRDIRLRLSEAVPSPAVCGLLRPTVLMPTSLVEKLSPEGLRATLIHELAHIKRGDLWINSVQTFLQVVYFYNPFVWFANSIIRKVCEEAVDETVLVALGGQAKDYSNTLIDIGEIVFWKSDLGLRLIGVAESRKALQWRIKHMLNRPIPKSSKLGALGIVMLFAIAAVLLPMARAEKAPEATKPVTAENEGDLAKSLHKAAADGDLEQIRLLLAKGSDINTRDEEYMTPLDLAAREGHKDMVEFLIAKGASIKELNGSGAKPAWLAMKNGHRDVVELLFKKGAKVLPMSLAARFGDTDRVRKLIQEGVDVNAKGDIDDRTALHWAVEHGHKDIAKLLIKNGADVSAGANVMRTPLHIATENEHKEMMELLIAHGADLMAKAQWGYTPLHAAAWGKSTDVAAVLIDAGANMFAGDKWGATPLHMAIKTDFAELVALFIANGMDPNSPVSTMKQSSWTSVHWAARGGKWGGGSKEVMQLLISKGVDINRKTGKTGRGSTPIEIAMGSSTQVGPETVRLLASHGAEIPPIHLAACLGDIEKVRACLEGGANVNAQWNRFGTPLCAAACGGQKDIAELLITKGADVNTGNKSEHTPLHYAAVNGSEEVVHLLIDKVADVHAKNSAGHTSIHLAGINKHKAVIDILLSKGADFNTNKEHGFKTLRYWAKRANFNMTEFLLARGADIEGRNMSGETVLFVAVNEDWLGFAQFLLSKGANINATDNNGKTPLSVAKGRGHAEMVELLLKHGAKEGSPSLHQAATDGDIERVKLFIAKGVDVNEKNQTGETPLHLAVARNQKAIVELLIAKGADIEAKCSRWGSPPLVSACAQGRRDIAELLLSKGADIEAKNSDGMTSLLMAAYSGKTRVAELLLSKGADTEARSNNNTTPLYIAIKNGNSDMVKLLLANGADLRSRHFASAPVGLAIHANQREIVQLLISEGAEFSPIHIAAYTGKLAEVKDYIAKGGDINAKDPSELTLLTSAICAHQTEIVNFLIKNGADVNLTDNGIGWTALHCASNKGQMEIVRMVIQEGADVNLKDELGQTPLWFPTCGGHTELVELLLAEGADANVRIKGYSDTGYRPLHIASKRGYTAVVELLITNGADVNAKTGSELHRGVRDEGLTPLHWSCTNGHEGLAKLLIDKGANVNAKTKAGKTPLSMAQESGHNEIAELLHKHGAKE